MHLRYLPLILALFYALPLWGRTFSETEFVEEFLKQNPRLAVLRLSPELAGEEERAFDGRFDWNLNLEANYLLNRSARSNTVFGSETRELNYSLGVAKKFPIGLQGGFEFSTERTQVFNSPFIPGNPFYEPILRFEARQNLLKNAFGFADRNLQRSLRLTTEQATLESRRGAEIELAQALSLYWELAAKQRLVVLNKRFLESAEEFEKSVKNRRRLGTAEKTDSLAAASLVLERKTDLSGAEASWLSTQEALLQLLQIPFGWEVGVSEEFFFGYSRSLGEELSQALEVRSDFLALKKELEARDLKVKVAANEKLPLVDLVASLELNGLRADYGNSLEDTFSADNPSLFAGMEASYPLPNRTAHASWKKEVLSREQKIYQLKDLETTLLKEVRAAHRDLQLKLAQLANFEKIRDLQKEKWQEEKKKFLQGRSSSDTVIRFEREWLEAEGEFLQAQWAARMAAVQLKLSTGNLIPPPPPSLLPIGEEDQRRGRS